MKAIGASVALVSVVASGMQQITCGELQRKHTLTPNQLLSVSAPMQVLLRRFCRYACMPCRRPFCPSSAQLTKPRLVLGYCC